MSILDTIAPRRGQKQRRYGLIFLSKTAFYATVAGFVLLTAVLVIFFDEPNELNTIAPTRVDSEIIAGVQNYLQTTTHRGFLNQDEPASCWGVFENATFSAEYLLFGSWQVNAWYDKVRYYWRVDDVSLDVTIDGWLQTYNGTVDC
jgi:hypothetical protein